MRSAAAAREDLSVSLWLRLMKAHALLLARARRSLEGACTLPQFDVLAQLDRAAEGLTSRDLSRRLLVTAGNLTVVVRRLERIGWVRREAVPGDRRSARIVLTAEGRRRAAALIARHRRDLARALAPVPGGTQSRLRAVLGRAIAGIETDGGAPRPAARPRKPADRRRTRRRS